MGKKYFKLFSCCIPVKGARRSIICDVQREQYKFIPTILYDILNNYVKVNKTIDQIKSIYQNQYDDAIDSYFDFLIENEFGFFCDNPKNFPELDLTWKVPNQITNAILDVDLNSKHNFNDIFTQLDDLGCIALQIRIYPIFQIDIISSWLKNLNASSLRSIELLMHFDSSLTEDHLRRFLKENGRVTRLVIHSSSEDKYIPIDHGAGILYLKKQILSNECCGVISSYNFIINIDSFTESQNYNSCLNKKISIDVDGSIKNCPSMKNSFGNINTTSLNSVLAKKKFKNLWEINKDQIEVCKDCEFRYICTDCRAFISEASDIYSKPSKCNYDPYTATWK